MLASGKPVLATADAGTELFEVLSGKAILVPAGTAWRWRARSGSW
jgi:colanic acid biosynthesis glycosyl transferase WcaI